MTTKERRALAVLFTVGLAGHAIRLFASRPDSAPGGVTIASALGAPDVRVHRAHSAAAGRALAEGERLDLNLATARDLDRLPGVGPGLAARLISERKRRGGFRSLAAVDSVPGVGDALLKRIAPFLTLPDTGRRKPPAQSVVPGAPPAPVVVVPRAAKASGSGARVRVNTASERDLETLRGIGPTKAKAIVAYRQANGPFASVTDLEKVPGLSAALVKRFAPQVIVP